MSALLNGGAAVNQPSPGDQATPLLVALINGHFDVAASLLDHGADPNLVSDAGVSPLYATLNVQWAPIAAYPQPRAHLQQSRTHLDMLRLLANWSPANPDVRFATAGLVALGLAAAIHFTPARWIHERLRERWDRLPSVAQAFSLVALAGTLAALSYAKAPFKYFQF